MFHNSFDETVAYIRKQLSPAVAQPKVGVILGTGMGHLVNAIDIDVQIAYNFIPHFPVSTVESHFGKLIFGKIAGQCVIAMQGRFHYYEGYSMAQITYPIRIMKLLGVETLYVSNAAGAVNLGFKKGNLMILDDHLNLLPENPLRGANIASFGPRFPDMSQPYDFGMIKQAEAIAAEENFTLYKGVYAAVPGPNLETRAEYRYLSRIGADAVGMSTVPEVIVANHCGIKTCAISVLTDECDPDHLVPVTVEEVIAVASQAEPKLTRLISRLIETNAA